MTRGTIRVRRHCTFRWWRANRWWDDSEERKTVEVEPHHCQACITAVQKLEFGDLVASRLESELVAEVDGEKGAHRQRVVAMSTDDGVVAAP